MNFEHFTPPFTPFRVRNFHLFHDILKIYGGAQSMSVGENELSAPVAAPERIVKFCGGTGRI
jgi:hypothetical protein